MKKQIKSGPKGVQRAMSKASGSSSRDLSRYMGEEATLVWRDHDLRFSGQQEVAKGVSQYTAEVSSGEDPEGVWDEQ